MTKIKIKQRSIAHDPDAGRQPKRNDTIGASQSIRWVVAPIVLAIAVASGFARAAEEKVAAGGLELLSVQKIWDAGPHNAFTDLIRFKDKWVCAFREAPAHRGGVKDSRVRVIVSKDAEHWESAVAVDDPRGDIRDAKMAMTPDGRLMMLTAIQLFDTSRQRHQSLAWFTGDLREWEGPIDVGEADLWTWGIVFHKGAGYSIGYRTVDPRYVRLYRTRSGARWDVHVPDLGVKSSYPNESVIVFDPNDTAYCLLRCQGPAQLGVAKPPYRDWTWNSLGVPVGGPEMIQLPDGRFLGAGRIYQPKAHTSLFWIDPETPSLTEALELPSGGDTSYPGMVLQNKRLYMSYYSSHEGKTSVYLAKIRIRSNP